MSEFYESTNMDLCDNESINLENIKSKYFETKKMLFTLLSFFEMFEDDFYLTINDIQKFLTFHNIMDLSYIFQSYYILQNYDMLESAHHIIQKSMMTDDILDEDLFMYCKAYIFIRINDETHKHDELFDNILYLSNYHNHYLSGQLANIISMIEMEESFISFSL
jgi:hypothetical protein